jgi:hypothetical protein
MPTDLMIRWLRVDGGEWQPHRVAPHDEAIRTVALLAHLLDVLVELRTEPPATEPRRALVARPPGDRR